MRAISLHQPWASFIAEGHKTIETRGWSTSYRGDLLIVSTKKPKHLDYPLGQALCVVNVFDCVPMTVDHTEAACCDVYEGAWSWFLNDIRKIQSFPVRGSQGFYNVENDLILQEC